ncbi:MAG: tetratricopeptide repeat protein, partial [Gemmataceae bacterium]|nr:tetratricopeptide repeat protein [Gemmataceae bacterium]
SGSGARRSASRDERGAARRWPRRGGRAVRRRPTPGKGGRAAALPLCQKALALRKETLGSDHPLTATSLTHLGRLLQTMGDTEAALPLLREAVAIRKVVLGARHPEYARSLTYLAILLRKKGDMRALSFFQQALAIRKGVLGADHPVYAHSLGNIAARLKAEGDFPGARRLVERPASADGQARGRPSPLRACLGPGFRLAARFRPRAA